MGEEKQEDIGVLQEAPRICVCVGRERGILALKWALDNVVPPRGHVYLLHVKPPLRWIPNPMGGKLPVDQVNPELVKRFQGERFSEANRLVDNYTKLCSRMKVTTELCYSENDSIEKEVVDQVSKLGITMLVLETSSQNTITKALRRESTSAYVARHAPDFCSVIVVRRGKLFSVKDATRTVDLGSLLSRIGDVRISTSSETSSSSGEHNEDQSLMVGGFHNGEEGVQSRGQCSSPHSRLLQSASMDIYREPSEWPMPHIIQSPPTKMMLLRNHSDRPPISRLSGSPPVTPSHQRIDYWQRHYNDKVNSVVGLESPSVPNGYPGRSSPSSVLVEDLGSDCDALSQRSVEIESSTGSSTLEVLLSQTSSHEMEFVQMDTKPGFVNNEALFQVELDLLQRRLNEAKQSSQDWALREAERQANNFKMAEEMVENMRKKLSEYEKHRDDALNDARCASQKAPYYQKECERAGAMLQTALAVKGTLQERIAEEVRRHNVTQNDLETTRRNADRFARAVEVAEQEFQAERLKCEEVFLKLEEVTKELEKECQLRKEAEQRTSEEALAKREAIMALKEQRKYSEYSFLELQMATNNFHEENKLGQGGYGPVYKGRLQHTTVAIKILATEGSQGREEFQKEVELLSRIHHPHMVMLLGACPENGCIVYEYMANGSLEDRLQCRDGSPPLPWYVRFRICFEVATALLFLHSRPQPIVHRDLKPGNILLDHHFVSKVSDVGVAKLVPSNVTFSGVTMYKETVLVGTIAYMDPDYHRTGVVSCESDVYALGIVMLQLLTGRQAMGVAHFVEKAVDGGNFEEVLDKSAGEWPLAEAMAVACLSLECTEPRKHRSNLGTRILPELENIQHVAVTAAANLASVGPSSSGMPIIPGSFFCPISQEIMRDPHIAADGFTYEHDPIKIWLEEHDTSPMTNLVLTHKNLIPNFTLRSAITEWYDNGLL